MTKQNENVALTEAVYYILLSLYTPMHGYAIMQNINSLSNGRLNLGAGTLYGAINVLLEKQWIEKTGDHSARKKEYSITALGKCMVEAEVLRLEELLKNGKVIVGGEPNE